MKTYKASEELVQIFKQNGFIDITNEMYPEHFDRISNNGYDPNRVKRVLAINKNNYVKFDYITILPCYKRGCSGEEMKTELTPDELKSIIAFFNLPTQTKSSLKRHRQNILDLHKKYYDIKENPNWYKDKQSKLIIESFEKAKLN